MSDFDAVEPSVFDARWQMVLGRLGETEPAFSQGALQAFREQLIASDMDRRLLERTIELARATSEFDWKKLPKTLRVAIDSSPLEGAGRVEDSINLLAHAGRKVVDCAAELLGWTVERVYRDARAPLLAKSSVKKALDLDWSDPAQMASAARILAMQLGSLQEWIATNLKQELKKPPLKDDLDTLAQLMDQDLEPDPDGGGMKIRGARSPGRPGPALQLRAVVRRPGTGRRALPGGPHRRGEAEVRGAEERVRGVRRPVRGWFEGHRVVIEASSSPG